MTITANTASSAAAGGATEERQEDHVLIFPFMAKGHTIPLLHLSAALAARGVRVTILTTPANAPFLRRFLPFHRPTNIKLIALPFPSFPPLPPGCESTDSLPSFDLFPVFLRATTLLRPSFHRLLLSLSFSSDLPLCVISDFFLGWTLDVCQLFGVPRIVFHGMGAFSLLLCKALCVHRPHETAADDEPFQVPGTPGSLQFTRAEVPEGVRNAGNPDDPVGQFVSEIGQSDVTSWGVLVNSFAELEGDYIAPVESFYQASARAWLVGPMTLLPGRDTSAENNSASNECVLWLDGKPEGSVVYVSFGTQAHVSDEQLTEVARGLDAACCEFLWVVRSATWAPTGMKRGKIVAWAPQAAVLEHAAVGGFLSHCGWNSCLESIAAGVPLLSWPMIAEQQLNAKLLVDVLGVGLTMASNGSSKLVKRKEITEGVRELMMGDGGRKASERAEELARAARAAVQEGGSSHTTLNQLLEELRSSTNNRWSDTREGVTMATDVLHTESKDGIWIA